MVDDIKKENRDLDINWLGMDGFLMLLYCAIVGLIFYALKTSNDFIIGQLIPYSVMTAVFVIFMTYIANVFTFMKKHHHESSKK